MIENIKMLLGLTTDEKDPILNLLIMQCIDDARQFTHREDTWEMNSLIEQMVVYRYNVLGAEGLTSEGYSGLSYHYTNDYPENILNSLKRLRKLVIV